MMGSDERLWRSVVLGKVNWAHRSALVSQLEAHQSRSVDFSQSTFGADSDDESVVILFNHSALSLKRIKLGTIRSTTLELMCTLNAPPLSALHVQNVDTGRNFFDFATLGALQSLQHLELRAASPIHLPAFSFRFGSSLSLIIG